jgi:hypothetical protein
MIGTVKVRAWKGVAIHHYRVLRRSWQQLGEAYTGKHIGHRGTMSPEVQSASSRYNAAGDGFNAPEASTESPYLRGLEMLPESRNVASVQNHNVNTGEPAAPGDLHGYPGEATETKIREPERQQVVRPAHCTFESGKAAYMGTGPAGVNALDRNIYRISHGNMSLDPTKSSQASKAAIRLQNILLNGIKSKVGLPIDGPPFVSEQGAAIAGSPCKAHRTVGGDNNG